MHAGQTFYVEQTVYYICFKSLLLDEKSTDLGDVIAFAFQRL